MADMAPAPSRGSSPGPSRADTPSVSPVTSATKVALPPRRTTLEQEGSEPDVPAPQTRTTSALKVPDLPLVIAAESSRAISAVSTLRAHGYTVTLDSPLVDPFETKHKVDTTFTSGEVVSAASKTPKEMRPDLADTKFNPIVIDNSEKGVIRVYNLLSQTPLVGEFRYTSATDKEERAGVTAKVHSLVARELQTANQSLQSPVERAPVPDYPISFDRTRKLSGEQVQALETLFDSVKEIRIYATGPSGPIPEAVLTRESFERSGFSPVVINGKVDKVYFQPAKGKSSELLADAMSQMLGTSKPKDDVTDVHGNRLEHVALVGGIYAHLRTSFAPDSATRDIRIDGRAVGLPVIDGILRDNNPTRVSRDGPIETWKLFDSGTDPATIAEQLRCFRAGAEGASQYFGAPGAVSRVLMIDGNERNASFRHSDPDTIRVDARFLSKPFFDPRLTAFHETAHLMDAKFKPRLSEGKVAEAWEGLKVNEAAGEKSSFIDEQHFFGRRAGGHAWQNSAEMFASAMTSLMHPKWEDKTMQLPMQDRAFYLAVLDAARSEMRAASGFPQNAPVLYDLDRKIYFLERAVPVAERWEPKPVYQEEVPARQAIPSSDRKP